MRATPTAWHCRCAPYHGLALVHGRDRCWYLSPWIWPEGIWRSLNNCRRWTGASKRPLLVPLAIYTRGSALPTSPSAHSLASTYQHFQRLENSIRYHRGKYWKRTILLTVANIIGDGDWKGSVANVGGPGQVCTHRPRGKRDSRSPNTCRFHRGVSDVSFCTSEPTKILQTRAQTHRSRHRP